MQERPYDPAYVASLPVSGMVYPDYFLDKCKYYFFKIYDPVHPYIADFLVKIRILRHDFRQNYLLGKLKPEKSINDFLSYLVSKGFKNHFIAWIDTGQVASLRLAYDFRHQYHLRIFKDGEIRGHYEYTPEYRPFAHLNETDMEERREDFLNVLKDWIDEA